jgi:hypothetical protein
VPQGATGLDNHAPQIAIKEKNEQQQTPGRGFAAGIFLRFLLAFFERKPASNLIPRRAAVRY